MNFKCSKKNNSQFSFSIQIAITFSKSSSNMIQIVKPHKTLPFNDQVPQVEILWVLKFVQNAFSYRNSDDVDELFRIMFPDSKVAQKFLIRYSKMSYVTSHDLGPHFRH